MIQYNWRRLKDCAIWLPLGMPIVRKLAPDLWEVRSKLENRIARILFTVIDASIVLLHGFIKKTEKTPLDDLSLAKERLSMLRGEK